ncbi:MAG: NUDIX domain-containing protein [Caulobacteraceae bacterium]|nr:NUDIX domain-containing protein [Caulobacteraceae bacterium]
MSGAKTIVRPRDAASLVLVRRSAKGLEVLMGRRPRKSAFAPDVFVFPGGKVEPGDRLARPLRPLDPESARRTGASPRLAEALAAAALRETAEETGLILPPDHGALTLMARAITPTESPIRFHARFFLADWDEAHGAHSDSHELTDLTFRSLEDIAKLPLMDVTEAVLASLGELDAQGVRPFLFTYRGGRPRHRPLA